MALGKKTLFTVIIILIFAFVITGGLFLYLKYKEPKSPAIEAIPKNAAFFIVTDQFTDVWNTLKETNLFWNDIEEIPQIKTIFTEWDFLFKNLQKNNKINTVPAEKQMILSFHYSGNHQYELLFLQELESNFQKRAINNFLRKIYGSRGSFNKENFNGKSIYTISFGNSERKYYYAYIKSLFIGSFDISLVETAIKQLDSKKSFLQDSDFIALKKTAGKKVDANIYINYVFFKKFLSDLIDDPIKPFLGFVSDLAVMTELDLFLKPDELLLNGFTTFHDDDKQYLKIFDGLNNRKVELTRILPSDVSSFLFIGVDSINTYYQKYLNYLKARNQYDEYSNVISQMNNKYQIKTSDMLCSAFDGELALAIINDNPEDKEEKNYGIFHLFPEKGKSVIRRMTEKSRKQSNNPYAPVNYKDFKIRKIEIPGLIPKVWGNLFSGLKSSYSES